MLVVLGKILPGLFPLSRIIKGGLLSKKLCPLPPRIWYLNRYYVVKEESRGILYKHESCIFLNWSST